MADAAPSARRRTGDELVRAVHGAVLVELAAAGYGGLTMEGVAARAGTGKQPLYRRWPAKDAMVLDTVRHGLPVGPTPPFSGDVRADLLGLLHGLAAALRTAVGGALRALLGETHRNPELAAVLDEAVFAPQRAALTAVLTDAVAAGQVRSDVLGGPLVSLGHETLVFRYLVDGERALDPATLETIVDVIVLPLWRPAGGAGV